MATVDHRRAVADRNRRGILDAAERLLAEHSALTMAALAVEAGCRGRRSTRTSRR
jgi:AcrR family transcriptional regulator